MTDRRLIEEALPLAKVNEASATEKSIRHGHISTLHLWWARRPLAMSRAVVFGTLLPDPGDDQERSRILNLMAEAAPFDASVKTERIRPLKELLAEIYSDEGPAVLDCFAGGGAIPLEALRLGCKVTSSDLNPVAYLIEKCTLEYPQRFGHSADGANPLADDFVRWARWVHRRVGPDFTKVFPVGKDGRRPAVYFWARTMNCANPACRIEIPLLTTRWLANSARRTVWLEMNATAAGVDLSLRSGQPPSGVDPAIGTVKASSVTCPRCGHSLPAKEVRIYGRTVGFGRRLLAVLETRERIRTYRAPRPDEVEGAEKLATEKLSDLESLAEGVSALPDEKMAKSQYRRYTNLIYGIDSFRGLFNDRQLFVLGSLCAAVRDAHAAMLEDGMDADRARAVATYLGLCVDRIADYNSSFCLWAISGEFVAHTFARQAIPMVWDFTEIDPLADISGNWDGATRWIELVIRHCASTGNIPATVQRADSQALPFLDDSFDAVVIDPPYYDAVQYGDLSDYFYVWLKRSIGHLYPELFSTPLAPKSQEIIESRADKKSLEHISHDEFEKRLQRALGEIARVVKPSGIVSIVFAHTDVEAWERLLRALQSARLVVSTSWPMRSERAARMTAMISAVLNSSVVLVCRPQTATRQGFYDDVVRELESRIAERLDTFDAMGLVGADYFISAVGPAFEVFAQYSVITRLSGEEVDVSDLMVLARQTVARHAMRRLLGEQTLTALDTPSLFYLTWRWAYLAAAIPADEAYKLERAFNVDLGAMTRPGGFVKQAGSTFSVLGPDERKDIKLSVSPSLIDVLHLSCRLWDSGRRKELEELLGATGMGTEPGFWATARTLGEILPDGNKERTMLLGLTGNRDALSAAAAKSTTNLEELRLFG